MPFFIFGTCYSGSWVNNWERRGGVKKLHFNIGIDIFALHFFTKILDTIFTDLYKMEREEKKKKEKRKSKKNEWNRLQM